MNPATELSSELEYDTITKSNREKWKGMENRPHRPYKCLHQCVYRSSFRLLCRGRVTWTFLDIFRPVRSVSCQLARVFPGFFDGLLDCFGGCTAACENPGTLIALVDRPGSDAALSGLNTVGEKPEVTTRRSAFLALRRRGSGFHLGAVA